MSTAIAQYGDSNCARILCAGDDVVDLLDIPRMLDADHDFVIVASVEEGEVVLANEPAFDLIISGPQLNKATDFIDRLRRHSPDAERIILTCPGDTSAVRMATSDARVMRVLMRPCPANKLRDAVYDALLRHRARVLRAEFGNRLTPRSTLLLA